MRVQMLGLCRFSYLGGRGFQVGHASLEERRAFLYDPERLARRWRWFEAVCLPGLMSQTDQDFTLVIMTGPDLPEPYMTRLRELCGVMPQARLSLIRPMNYHLQACKHALMPHRDPTAEVVGHFRQDDDDGVAVDFIERARADFDLLQPVWQQKKAASIDYMRGVLLTVPGGRIRADARMIYNASAGLVIYLPPEDERSAVTFPHWRIGHHMPGLVLPDKVMFARLLNHDNDSGDAGPGYDFDDPPGDMAALLWDRLRIRMTDIADAAREQSVQKAARQTAGQG